MIVSQKCNCCLHDGICSYKQQYINACKAVGEVTYTTDGESFKNLKNSEISVSINCPHMMTKVNVRDINS
jgi:hypothetical protein